MGCPFVGRCLAENDSAGKGSARAWDGAFIRVWFGALGGKTVRVWIGETV